MTNNMEENMKIIENAYADIVRAKFISAFINLESLHYKKYIQPLHSFRDGLCYVGYLWDCLKNKTLLSESESDAFLKGMHNLLIMWDIHSCEKILIPDYWKYPKKCILSVSEWKGIQHHADLPEDIYVFDESYSWCIIFTHETDQFGNRYCCLSSNERV